jgi:hypothetical protein
MTDPNNGGMRRILDFAAPGLLVLAMLAVYLVDRNKATTKPPENIVTEEDDGEGDPEPNRPLRIGVVYGQWDQMGKLLKELGAGYEFTQLSITDLVDARKLGQYDVIFLCCGPWPNEWFNNGIKVSSFTGLNARNWNADRLSEVRSSLKQFLDGGGTIYSSDYQYVPIAMALPEMANTKNIALGAPQTLDAEVVDDGLAEALGGRDMSL